jgi:hypothetical protein
LPIPQVTIDFILLMIFLQDPFIDVDVVNDPDSTANRAVPALAVPAEFAGFSAVERFIGYLGRNSKGPSPCIKFSGFRSV